MAYFLGIDTSTTSSKALLIDEGGEVVAVVSSTALIAGVEIQFWQAQRNWVR